MSKLSRYNLLISLIRSELKFEHVLATSNAAEHNQLLYARSIEAWIFLSEDLMCENLLLEQSRLSRIRNVLSVLNTNDTSLTLGLLKDVYDVLINHISQKEVLRDYNDFKDHFSEKQVPLIGKLLSPIKESLIAVIQSQTFVRRGCFTTDVKREMWRCSHFLLFLSKINFEGVGLEEKALADYNLFEDETSRLDLNNISKYIKPLQSILYDWLKDWSYDGLRSKHGPGSVADAKPYKVQKYLTLASDKKVEYLYQNDADVINTILPFGYWCKHLDRTSKLVFVPKNITKLRSISMEPTTLQYLQQGCMESLYNYFDDHHALRKILQLKNQSQNQSYAYHGSITNDYATIDLSHASDSVNWDLTKKLFARVPQLLKWLVCTRSTHTLLPTGERIRLSKFAPMGSALCFPIESLIFAAIAELSIRLSKESASDRNNVTGIRSQYNYLTVYGDDIIVPTYAASLCIELLQRFGFTPNEEKSYLDGPFKESCGGNYFCGYDVTALKFAPSFDTSHKMGVSPEAYTALCSYANLAYERGLYLFRLYCIKLIFEAELKPLFSDRLDTAPAIYSPTPTNFHLKKIFVKRYQKYQYLYTGVKTVEEDVKNDLKDHVGHIFLYDYLQSRNFNTRKGDVTSLLTANAVKQERVVSTDSFVKNCLLTITYDTENPYSRKTLLPQVFKYTLCKSDT